MSRDKERECITAPSIHARPLLSNSEEPAGLLRRDGSAGRAKHIRRNEKSRVSFEDRNKIAELGMAGMKEAEIAGIVKWSPMTVSRYLRMDGLGREGHRRLSSLEHDQIIALNKEGIAKKEIAVRLGATVRTVSDYITREKRKEEMKEVSDLGRKKLPPRAKMTPVSFEDHDRIVELGRLGKKEAEIASIVKRSQGTVSSHLRRDGIKREEHRGRLSALEHSQIIVRHEEGAPGEKIAESLGMHASTVNEHIVREKEQGERITRVSNLEHNEILRMREEGMIHKEIANALEIGRTTVTMHLIKADRTKSTRK
jgi:DNA-binding CsgD family transcriptional regulator